MVSKIFYSHPDPWGNDAICDQAKTAAIPPHYAHRLVNYATRDVPRKGLLGSLVERRKRACCMDLSIAVGTIFWGYFGFSRILWGMQKSVLKWSLVLIHVFLISRQTDSLDDLHIFFDQETQEQNTPTRHCSGTAS